MIAVKPGPIWLIAIRYPVIPTGPPRMAAIITARPEWLLTALYVSVKRLRTPINARSKSAAIVSWIAALAKAACGEDKKGIIVKAIPKMTVSRPQSEPDKIPNFTIGSRFACWQMRIRMLPKLHQYIERHNGNR